MYIFLRRILKYIIIIVLYPLRLLQRNDYVCYYPAFQNKEDLINHYFRASWYLPKCHGVCTKIFFARSYVGDDPCRRDNPHYMRRNFEESSHMIIIQNRILFWMYVLRSKRILVWSKNVSEDLIRIFQLCSKNTEKVDTNDVTIRESQVYCQLLWNLQPKDVLRTIIEESKTRFLQYYKRISGNQYKIAYVFGNGPSLEDAYQFDFQDGVRIMCNAAVKDKNLLDHVRPHFIIAGDMVWHFGVSRFAEKYQEDLIELLYSRDILYVIPASNSFNFYHRYPELIHKIVLVPVFREWPNYNLLEDFRVPCMFSVINALMLPIASTFCDDIRLLGCDGLHKSYDNEDFWAHAKTAHYYEEVSLGHLCHPTFDLDRKRIGELVRVNIDIAKTILIGEGLHGKRYRCLRPSNLPLLDTRLIP